MAEVIKSYTIKILVIPSPFQSQLAPGVVAAPKFLSGILRDLSRSDSLRLFQTEARREERDGLTT